jgi:hypothetical protein
MVVSKLLVFRLRTGLIENFQTKVSIWLAAHAQWALLQLLLTQTFRKIFSLCLDSFQSRKCD